MHRTAILIACVVALTSAPPGGAVNIVVNQTNDPFTSDGLCSLREAMFAAAFDLAFDGCVAGAPGHDDVVLGAGTFALRAPIVLGGIDSLTLRGAGAAATAIQPEPGESGRLFFFHDGGVAIVRDLTLRGARASATGGATRGGALRAVDFHLTLAHVTLDNNRANAGGGLSFETISSASHLLIVDSTFSGNVAEENPVPTIHLGVPRPMGGGLLLDLQGASSFANILDSRFQFNLVAGKSAPELAGGALAIRLGSETYGELRRLQISSNRALGSAVARQIAGIDAAIAADSTLFVADSRFFSQDTVAAGPGSVTAFAAEVLGALEVERTAFAFEDTGETATHVEVVAGAGAGVRFGNSLIASGPAVGLTLSATNSDLVQLAHLTVSDHGSTGIEIDANAPSRLENSILWANGANLISSGPVAPTLTANLVGIDPLFALPDSYELAASSPAVDTGDDSLGSLAFLDLRHAPRKVGLHTDRGAHERRGIFADDFSAGDASAWSGASP